MKQQYDTAQKRIREEMELKNKFEQELIREHQRIQELTIQNEQQQKILKLKTEGLVAAQRKLRGASNGNINDGTTTTMFDIEMEKLINERKELEVLRDDIQKREELIQKKELLLNEKTELEAKKTQANQSVNIDKRQLNHQMTREQLIKQKRLFTERLEEQNGVLTPSEERRLIEIDETIEAVDLAIDYQNNIISKRERDVQQSIRASQVFI
jgi:kinesin family protein 7